MKKLCLIILLCLALLVQGASFAWAEDIDEDVLEIEMETEESDFIEDEDDLLIYEEEDEEDSVDYEILDEVLLNDYNGKDEELLENEEDNISAVEDEPVTNNAVSNAYDTVYYEDCIYKVIKPFSLCAEPAADSKKTSGLLWYNQTIHVVAVVRNQYNNMWLKTDSGGFVYGGYRWKDNKWVKDGDQYVEFVSKNNNVSWNDNNIAGKTLTYGKPYNLSGTIRSSFTMFQIVGALYDGDTWKSTSGIINVNTTAYSVYKSALDLNLKFGSLPYSDQLKLKVQVQYYYDRGQKKDAHSFVFNFSNKDGIDRTPPSISGISISDVSSSGYTVSCSVSDNTGISHVAFPTWTTQNGQDDIFSDWGNTARGTISNGVATYRVNVSEHNNETGCSYVTHIYAWDTNGNQSLAEAGTIYVPEKVVSVIGVSLSETSLSMKTGDTYSITATVSPGDATNKAISWSSSNPSVATISNGKVTAIGIGTATITVTTSDGNKTATCLVSVQATSVSVVGVSISPTKLTLSTGATKLISATVYPSNATDNRVRFTSSDADVAFVDSNGILAGVGVGSATITATTVDGGYTAYLKVTVNPKGLELTKVKAGKKKLTVQWKKQKNVTGYQVQYGLKSNFSDGKTLTIAKTKTVKKDIKKLKAKKKYYVRIRAYKTVKGKKYYSAWSKVKYAKTKK